MAGNIVGPPFDNWVSKQIDVRQKINKITSEKSVEVLRYQNANTAFLRLSSGVNVDGTEEQMRNIVGDNSSLKGNGLAKTYQLFSTRFLTNEDPNNPQFASGARLGGNSAYGWKSTSGYGLVPPPGLVSADIKSLNQGSLREATINIQCHSMEQFEIIEKLYLRLGYTMLLEWGWAFYFNNDNELTNSYHNIATDQFFFNNTSDYLSILNQIQNDRYKSNGNYEAMVGLVKNYSWNLEKDGSFSITLYIISIGSVIESIKSNVSLPYTATTSPTQNQTAVEYNKDKSTLNQILYYFTTLFPNDDPNDFFRDSSYTTADNIGKNIGLTPSQNNNGNSNADIITFPFPQLKGVTKTNQSYKWEYYIRLGCLLRTIQNFILYYSKNNNKQSLINFDFDEENNFMFTIPRQISLDPRVCLIQPSSKVFTNDFNPNETTLDRQKKGFYAIENQYSWQTIKFDDDRGEFTLSERYPRSSISYFDGSYGNIENIDAYYATAYVSYLGGYLGDKPNFEGNTSLNKDKANEFLKFNIRPGAIVSKTTSDKIPIGDSTIPKTYEGGNQTLLEVYSEKKEEEEGFSDSIKVYFNLKEGKTNYSLKTDDIGKIFLISTPQVTTISNTFTSDEGNNELHNITITINTYTVKYWTIYNTVTDELTQNAQSNDKTRDPNVVTTNNNIYSKIAPSNFRVNDYDFIGRTMNMFVNINYIAETLEKYIDISNNNSISLYDFLDKLLVGIQNALGNINYFNITYDEDQNSFKITDKTFIPGLNQYKPEIFNKEVTKFITHTLDKNDGSFVRNASVNTKLSNNFATQVSVGAQANGNVVGENATALSKWNVGLFDRISKDKTVSGVDPANNSENMTSNYISFTILYNAINSGNVTTGQLDSLKNPCVELFNYDVGAYTKTEIIPGVGFLPIDLELTMDGLSGMKLFESYTADDRLLPSNYRNKIQFIITGMSHKIQNNDWTTTINSISGPKFDGTVTKKAPGISPLSPGVTTPVTAPPPSSVPLVIVPGKKGGTPGKVRLMVVRSYADANQTISRGVILKEDGSVLNDQDIWFIENPWLNNQKATVNQQASSIPLGFYSSKNEYVNERGKVVRVDGFSNGEDIKSNGVIREGILIHRGGNTKWKNVPVKKRWTNGCILFVPSSIINFKNNDGYYYVTQDVSNGVRDKFFNILASMGLNDRDKFDFEVVVAGTGNAARYSKLSIHRPENDKYFG
jgi:hypothetical protein